MTDSGKEILNKAYKQGWLSGFDLSLLNGFMKGEKNA